MAILNLNPAEKDYICELKTKFKESQRDIAVKTGLSRTTVRRVLAEKGLCTYSNGATPEERNILNILKSYGITNTTDLYALLAK